MENSIHLNESGESNLFQCGIQRSALPLGIIATIGLAGIGLWSADLISRVDYLNYGLGIAATFYIGRGIWHEIESWEESDAMETYETTHVVEAFTRLERD